MPCPDPACDEVAVTTRTEFVASGAPRRTAQHSTAQHSTAQHSTAQHSTAQHSTAQHSTAQHSTAQHHVGWLSTPQHKCDSFCASAAFYRPYAACVQADDGGGAMRRPRADMSATEARAEAIRLGREAAKRERQAWQQLEKLVRI